MCKIGVGREGQINGREEAVKALRSRRAEREFRPGIATGRDIRAVEGLILPLGNMTLHQFDSACC